MKHFACMQMYYIGHQLGLSFVTSKISVTKFCPEQHLIIKFMQLLVKSFVPRYSETSFIVGIITSHIFFSHHQIPSTNLLQFSGHRLYASCYSGLLSSERGLKARARHFLKWIQIYSVVINKGYIKRALLWKWNTV